MVDNVLYHTKTQVIKKKFILSIPYQWYNDLSGFLFSVFSKSNVTDVIMVGGVDGPGPIIRDVYTEEP